MRFSVILYYIEVYHCSVRSMLFAVEFLGHCFIGQHVLSLITVVYSLSIHARYIKID